MHESPPSAPARPSSASPRGMTGDNIAYLFTTAQRQDLVRLHLRWMREQAAVGERQHQRWVFARYLVQMGRLSG